MDQPSEFEASLAALEARVAALEGGHPSQPQPPRAGSEDNDGDATSIVRVQVTNKRFDAGEFQSHIWFDCLFTAVGVAHPARAIKGTIEFCDLFGDPKLNIEHVISDRLEPGSSVSQPGLGIVFNEFMLQHQWLRGTELTDMTVRFRVSQILDEDAAISGHGASAPSVQNSIPAPTSPAPPSLALLRHRRSAKPAAKTSRSRSLRRRSRSWPSRDGMCMGEPGHTRFLSSARAV